MAKAQIPETTDTTKSHLIPDIVTGMDHKAIVWCHSVLATVRALIDYTSKAKFATLTNQQKLDAVRSLLWKHRMSHTDSSKYHNSGISDDDNPLTLGDYMERVMHQKVTLQKSLTLLQSWSIQTTIPYNIQLLLLHYTIVSLFHLILLPHQIKYMIALTAILQIKLSQTQSVVVILTLMAYVLYALVIGCVLLPIIRILLSPVAALIIPSFSQKKGSTSVLIHVYVPSLLLLLLIMSLLYHSASLKLQPVVFFLHFITFILSWTRLLLTIPFNNYWNRQKQPHDQFAAAMLAMGIIIPIIYSGKLVYVFSLFTQKHGELYDVYELPQACAKILCFIICFNDTVAAAPKDSHDAVNLFPIMTLNGRSLWERAVYRLCQMLCAGAVMSLGLGCGYNKWYHQNIESVCVLVCIMQILVSAIIKRALMITAAKKVTNKQS